ncbi:MAG: hypothetical protein ACKVY0_15035 [Prosthecobacter sp.]|uniref:hypothetical protein n=1 Tax=Prosthecobacter sp. TaxID=1965333 RepID=UPI0038FED1D5
MAAESRAIVANTRFIVSVFSFPPAGSSEMLSAGSFIAAKIRFIAANNGSLAAKSSLIATDQGSVAAGFRRTAAEDGLTVDHRNWGELYMDSGGLGGGDNSADHDLSKAAG